VVHFEDMEYLLRLHSTIVVSFLAFVFAQIQPGQLLVGDQTKRFRRIEEAAAPEGLVG
jgi:hypothetical protein